MRLTYRGVRYNALNQPAEVIHSSQEGRFLGARYRIVVAKSHLPKQPSNQPSEQLSYRLAKYSA